MMYSDIPSAQTLVFYFKSRGIRNIVISPGSRNAPLTLGFSKNPFFKCFSIVDERCAAFFALGMAQQSQTPVAVVCTSGSALVNYYPAITEAFYSDIPLIVVSADRPPYKIDVGDGQTIRQENIFKNHIGFSANLKQDVSHAMETFSFFDSKAMQFSQEQIQVFNEQQIETALTEAVENKSPVHINIPFEEPLYGQLTKPIVSFPEYTANDRLEHDLNNFEKYQKVWGTSNRIMVLVGVNQPDAIEPSIIERLAIDYGVLVFTETTSNLHHPQFFPSIDSIIAPIEKSKSRDELFGKLQPDLLVTFGGLIVSKKIKSFLRSYQPKEHWHIDSKKAYDTFFCLSEHIKIAPNVFFNGLFKNQETKKSTYKSYWATVRENYKQKRNEYLEQIEFSDFKVFDSIIKSIPKGHQVHLGNSSTVRYAQLFPMHGSLKVFCNRGASGIDGSTSTAIGASVHSKSPTVLITGDLSFFYDSNALWNEYTKADFRIILINNSGGGIFRILPGAEESGEFETFFETKHQLTAEQLARMYNFDYSIAKNEDELKNCLSGFYHESTRPRILEITTPRLKNNKILLDYFDFIS